MCVAEYSRAVDAIELQRTVLNLLNRQLDTDTTARTVGIAKKYLNVSRRLQPRNHHENAPTGEVARCVRYQAILEITAVIRDHFAITRIEGAGSESYFEFR